MKSKKPAKTKKMPKADSQSERFKQAARELECDEDEARWDERLKKIAKANSKSEEKP
jgi:hypothetical protein